MHTAMAGKTMVECITSVLSQGTQRSRGIAAKLLWELCAKDGTQRGESKTRKFLTLKRDNLMVKSKAKMKNMSIAEAGLLLGDGSEQDYVKQVCLCVYIYIYIYIYIYMGKNEEYVDC